MNLSRSSPGAFRADRRSSIPTMTPPSPVRTVCPACRASLSHSAASATCTACGSVYPRDTAGFINFDVADLQTADDNENDGVRDEYSKTHSGNHLRLYNAYIRPLIEQEPTRTVLDVGCFLGEGIASLQTHGYDAHAVDTAQVLPFWSQAGRNPERFVSANASIGLPYPDDTFDFVISTGVIEHIGTTDGHATLRPDYEQCRQTYASELLRVTRPGGRILLSAPNKRFPIDLQHGPMGGGALRRALYDKAGINIHPIAGRNHLPTYREVRALFEGATSLEALPLAGNFGFSSLNRPLLRPLKKLAEAYVNHLPRRLRETGLNPYMLVLVRK